MYHAGITLQKRKDVWMDYNARSNFCRQLGQDRVAQGGCLLKKGRRVSAPTCAVTLVVYSCSDRDSFIASLYQRPYHCKR